jgi:NAD(P)H-hydrate epimerase
MEPIVTRAEMAAFDRHTIEALSVPARVLMETAGRAVADAAERLGQGPVVVLAGPGNNGGDGLVAARALHARGRAVSVLLLDEAAMKGDAEACLSAARAQGVRIEPAAVAALQRLPEDAILVDALYGTGLSRSLEGEPARLVAAMNELGRPVVAVDIPSGLDADRGVPLGLAVRAHTTVTFGFRKRGMCGSPGFTYAGLLECADIGIPRALADGVRARLLDGSVLAPFLDRDPLGHKGTHGHVLLVAGSVGKIGAALLAGRAALRAGAGLCTLASPSAAQARLEGRLPELMTFGYPLGDGASGAQTGIDVGRTAAALMQELTGKRVIAIGPGVPTAPAFAEVIERMVYGATAEGLTVVLDADGINHLAHRPSILGGRPGVGQVVLTPHPGEAARLLGSNVATVEADRFAAAAGLAERYGAVVALKGARTVIAAPDGRIAVCAAGGTILGVGGTGDVLTGAVGALLASQLAPSFESTCAAVYLHARAADLVAATGQPLGMLASELADRLPRALSSA